MSLALERSTFVKSISLPAKASLSLLCKQGSHHALAADGLVPFQRFLYAYDGLCEALQILLYCKSG